MTLARDVAMLKEVMGPVGKLVTADYAMLRLSCSRSTITRLIRSKRLQRSKVRFGNRLTITLESLLALEASALPTPPKSRIRRKTWANLPQNGLTIKGVLAEDGW